MASMPPSSRKQHVSRTAVQRGRCRSAGASSATTLPLSTPSCPCVERIPVSPPSTEPLAAFVWFFFVLRFVGAARENDTGALVLVLIAAAFAVSLIVVSDESIWNSVQELRASGARSMSCCIKAFFRGCFKFENSVEGLSEPPNPVISSSFLSEALLMIRSLTARGGGWGWNTTSSPPASSTAATERPFPPTLHGFRFDCHPRATHVAP